MDLKKEFFPEKIFDIEFKELIKSRNREELNKLTSELYPADIAYFIEELESVEEKTFLLTLSGDLEFIIDIFEELETADQEDIITNLKDTELVKNIVNEMSADDRADFFANISEKLSEKLQQKLHPDEKENLELLLKYDESTAGGLMTTDFIVLRDIYTVRDAIKYLRENHQEAETINYEFVVDKKNRLCGILSLRTLVISKPDSILSDIMENNVIYTYANMDQEDVAALFQKYDIQVLPVLDKNDVIVGIITIDDVLDVIEDEATEDIQKIGASLPLEESYFDTTIFELIKKRFIWLVGLLLVGTVTCNILKTFESILGAMISLSYFIPTITGTGGNTGTQSATMIIRGIAIGEIEHKDFFKVLKREFIIGLIMGVLLAMLGFLQSFLVVKTLTLSLTLALALVFTTLASACVGGMLPLIAKKLKLDPAVMSGPFISTVVDIGGLVIYLQTAKFVLYYLKII